MNSDINCGVCPRLQRRARPWFSQGSLFLLNNEHLGYEFITYCPRIVKGFFACKRAIAHIRDNALPVVYEEAFHNTLWFVRKAAQGVKVIIPHLGGLNGEYEALVSQGLWENPHVYTDIALVSAREISDYIQRYGPERILFGSDFPGKSLLSGPQLP